MKKLLLLTLAIIPSACATASGSVNGGRTTYVVSRCGAKTEISIDADDLYKRTLTALQRREVPVQRENAANRLIVAGPVPLAVQHGTQAPPALVLVFNAVPASGSTRLDLSAFWDFRVARLGAANESAYAAGAQQFFADMASEIGVPLRCG